MDEKIIVANRFDGLGERLIALLNALYLSNECQASFKFIWNSMDETNHKIAGEHIIFPSVPKKELFFSKEFINKYFFIDYKEDFFDHILWYNKGKCIKNVIKELFNKNNIIQCNLAIPIFGYFKDINKNEYRDKMKIIWNNIVFSKEIHEVISYANKISKELEEYCVLHIRGGDIVYRNDILYLLTSIALPVHLAIEILVQYSNKKIIIMGNDVELNNILKNKFNNIKNNKYILTSEDLLSDKILNAAQRAIFDIIIMSKSKKIFFSGHSGFSNLSYLIGSCEPIYIYDIYSTKEKYSIIEKNMNIYKFNKYHQSFSYMYLYIYGKELNLPFDIQLKNLESAIKLRDDAFVYRVLLIDILLQLDRCDDAEDYLSKLQDKIVLYIKDLLYEAHGVKGDFTYSFVFYHYFKIKNIKNYPILFSIAYLLCYKLINVNYSSFFDIINDFLFSHSIDFKVIEDNIVFMKEDKDNILSVLSRYYIYIIQTNGLTFRLKRSTAKARIQNQLSYKLGQAMIINSKSILGYIRMPFVLSYIKDKHKQEQKIYQEKIKKDPSLILPSLEDCPDYKEALKYKNHLSYKLGQALIKAHKNWYKGGYIRFWFDVYKIIKNKR